MGVKWVRYKKQPEELDDSFFSGQGGLQQKGQLHVSKPGLFPFREGRAD